VVFSLAGATRATFSVGTSAVATSGVLPCEERDRGREADRIVRDNAVRIALLALHFAEYASRLALALSQKHEVLLLVRSDNAQDELADDLRALLEERVTVRSVEHRRVRDPRFLGTVLSIYRIVRHFSPDILHIQETYLAYLVLPIWPLRRHFPIVLTVHDFVPHSRRDFRKERLYARWLRAQANRLIVHGTQTQAESAKLDGRLAGRVDAIPHGTLGRANVSDDISGDEPGTFLFFGRIEAYKGLHYLLDACEILRSRGHNFRLIVAGTGSDLEQHRRRIGASAWVELIDRYISAAEMPDLFRRATAVVLPYTDATQSGVCALAFAFARPVVATRTGDVPEVVINGQTGLLVPPRDAQALGDAMGQLLVDRRLRDSLAAGAGRFAKEKLSWPRIAGMTCDTYRRAISGA
jgi:glycosyltransferase involved in cell wall biosynthesis